MYHLSQLQSSILSLNTISLYHIVMRIILLYYTAILTDIILFVNKGCLSHTHILKSILRGNINYKAIRIFHGNINCKLISVSESNGNVYF